MLILFPCTHPAYKREKFDNLKSPCIRFVTTKLILSLQLPRSNFECLSNWKSIFCINATRRIQYSKALLNVVSVLRGGIGILLNHNLYCYLLHICANEGNAPTKSGVHYISFSTLFYQSARMLAVFSKVAITVRTYISCVTVDLLVVINVSKCLPIVFYCDKKNQYILTAFKNVTIRSLYTVLPPYKNSDSHLSGHLTVTTVGNIHHLVKQSFYQFLKAYGQN